MELNHTIVAHETFQVPSPLFWVAIIVSGVLAPASLNMALECQFISCLRSRQHSNSILLQFAKGDRRFPILSIPLWKVVWQKQHWSLRTWVGVFGVYHLASVAMIFVFSGGAVNYRQESYPYFAVIIAAAIHILSIAQQALLMYYSSRKVYNWIDPDCDPKAQTRSLHANFSRDRWRVFCASFCIEFAFMFYAFYTEMILVHVLRILFMMSPVMLLVSLPLELRRYHALYRTLGQVHPNSGSTVGASAQISVQKKKARGIAATTMRMSLTLIMGVIVQLTAVANPFAVRDQRLTTVALFFFHGIGTFLFCLKMLHHIVGTHREVHKQRKQYRQQQEQANKPQTTASKIQSIDPNASQLFG